MHEKRFTQGAGGDAYGNGKQTFWRPEGIRLDNYNRNMLCEIWHNYFMLPTQTCKKYYTISYNMYAYAKLRSISAVEQLVDLRISIDLTRSR